MNIFYLSRDIEEAARYHVDKHVVKMPIEYAQLLSSAMTSIGLTAPYKETHKNHPCAIWTRSSLANYQYVWDLADAVGNEYTRRYGKVHKSTDILRNDIPRTIDLPDLGFSDPPNCTSIKNTDLDIVDVYRLYYLTDKQHILQYKTEIPEWIMGDRFYQAQLKAIGTAPGMQIEKPVKPKRVLKADIAADFGSAGADKFTVAELQAMLPLKGKLNIDIPEVSRLRAPYESLFLEHFGFKPKAPIAAMIAALEVISSEEQ